jgi:hypothetical protein
MHSLWNWEFSSASGKDNVVGLPLRSGMGGCGQGSRRQHERGKVTAQPRAQGPNQLRHMREAPTESEGFEMPQRASAVDPGAGLCFHSMGLLRGRCGRM